MSGYLAGRVWREVDLSTTAKALMAKLADCADDFGNNVYPSVAYLHHQTQISVRHIKRLMAEFHGVGMGFLPCREGLWNDVCPVLANYG